MLIYGWRQQVTWSLFNRLVPSMAMSWSMLTCVASNMQISLFILHVQKYSIYTAVHSRFPRNGGWSQQGWKELCVTTVHSIGLLSIRKSIQQHFDCILITWSRSSSLLFSLWLNLSLLFVIKKLNLSNRFFSYI
jgi:hypothetical protein